VFCLETLKLQYCWYPAPEMGTDPDPTTFFGFGSGFEFLGEKTYPDLDLVSVCVVWVYNVRLCVTLSMLNLLVYKFVVHALVYIG